MEKLGKRLVIFLLLCAMLVSLVPFASAANGSKEMSAIAMLNYLTVLTQEINASANSQLYLDNAYSSIVNNINPNAVDNDSMDRINSLLETIESYRSIDVRRERAQYIYEQSQADAIREVIPDPQAILSLVLAEGFKKITKDFDFKNSIIPIVYMAIDAKSSYEDYLSEAEDKYIEEGWALDDEAVSTLNSSRSGAFSYMVEMCHNFDLDGKLALTENAVEQFVEWENNTNAKRRIEFFEKNEATYRAYGRYWLVLAESYYEIGEYLKCLAAIDRYENLNIDIFRQDHDFAQALVIGLAAAEKSKSEEDYIVLAKHYLELIEANIQDSDWLLCYVVAQTYTELYARTGKQAYLKKAYDLTKHNVNCLLNEQYAKNAEYSADVVKHESKNADSDIEKKAIKALNQWLEAGRKTELPPVYQPLVVNSQLLFCLAEELGISSKEKNDIDEMLHDEKQPLFYNTQLDNLFRFNLPPVEDTAELSIDGKTVVVPVTLLEKDTSVRVTLTSNGKDSVFDDWVLSEVDRGKDGAVEKFTAEFNSKTFKKTEFVEGDKVEIELVPAEGSPCVVAKYTFTVSISKKAKVLTDVTFVPQ